MLQIQSLTKESAESMDSTDWPMVSGLFTRCVIGDCPGGEGDGVTGFADTWDTALAAELGAIWVERGLIAGAFIDVDHLVSAVDGVLRSGASVATTSITLAPRRPDPNAPR